MAFFVDTWAGSDGVWASLPEQMKESMRKGAARTYHEWGDTPTPLPLCEDLRQLRVPTLLLKGAETARSVRALLDIAVHELPNAAIVEIKGAGHMAPFTHASTAAPHIVEHLRSV